MNSILHSHYSRPIVQQVSDILKAMSHPERLQILLVLQERDSSLQELCLETGLNATKIANHLQKMRQLGIVDYTRFMRIWQYRIISQTTLDLLRALPQLPKERT